MRIVSFITVILFIGTGTCAQQKDFPKLTGAYFGQEPPGNTPVKFELNFIPKGYKLHSSPAFMPGAEEVYFSAININVRFSEKIFVMKVSDNGFWEEPQIAPFSGNFFDGSPSISPDGKFLFFSSARTMDQKTINEDGERNIWVVERNEDGWGTPHPISYSTSLWENGTSLSLFGNLYFDSGDIYKISFPDGNEQNVRKLNDSINSYFTELHPCIAQDEHFLIFYSNRPGHYGKSGGDLYISFKDEDNIWKDAVNLGEAFNKGHLSTSFPRLSPDGEFLFFLKLVSVPWEAEVYWISVNALDKLNK